ncbi:MAG: cyclic nucleotide-binding domain-containing protein, partial [Arenicellales bacterium]
MQNTLGRFKLFHRLSEQECALIEAGGEWVRARTGETIIAEQRANKAFYIVIEGAVDVRLSDSVGSSIELASHGPGMMIGEYSFLDGLPAAASVVPATESVLFMISHDKLND